jgi:hypothetical protein
MQRGDGANNAGPLLKNTAAAPRRVAQTLQVISALLIERFVGAAACVQPRFFVGNALLLPFGLRLGQRLRRARLRAGLRARLRLRAGLDRLQHLVSLLAL